MAQDLEELVGGGKAAELLQVKPSTLNEMMKRLGIHSKSTAGVEEEVVTAD